MADRDAFLSVAVQFRPGIESQRRGLCLLRLKTPAQSARPHIRTPELLRVEKELGDRAASLFGRTDRFVTEGPARINACQREQCRRLLTSRQCPM
jgi:hypothetical protein